MAVKLEQRGRERKYSHHTCHCNRILPLTRQLVDLFVKESTYRLYQGGGNKIIQKLQEKTHNMTTRTFAEPDTTPRTIITQHRKRRK